MLGGIDRDRFQGVPLLHAGFDRQPGAQRQILLRNDWGIGDDRYLAAGRGQNARVSNVLLRSSNLLAWVRDGPTAIGTGSSFELLDDQMAFRYVFQRDLHIEFLRDPRAVNISLA